jgi:hypothetical protein
MIDEERLKATFIREFLANSPSNVATLYLAFKPSPRAYTINEINNNYEQGKNGKYKVAI